MTSADDWTRQGGPARAEAVLARAQHYVRQLPPHVRAREGAQIMMDLAEELELALVVWAFDRQAPSAPAPPPPRTDPVTADGKVVRLVPGRRP